MAFDSDTVWGVAIGEDNVERFYHCFCHSLDQSIQRAHIICLSSSKNVDALLQAIRGNEDSDSGSDSDSEYESDSDSDYELPEGLPDVPSDRPFPTEFPKWRAYLKEWAEDEQARPGGLAGEVCPGTVVQCAAMLDDMLSWMLGENLHKLTLENKIHAAYKDKTFKTPLKDTLHLIMKISNDKCRVLQALRKKKTRKTKKNKTKIKAGAFLTWARSSVGELEALNDLKEQLRLKTSVSSYEPSSTERTFSGFSNKSDPLSGSSPTIEIISSRPSGGRHYNPMHHPNPSRGGYQGPNRSPQYGGPSPQPQYGLAPPPPPPGGPRPQYSDYTTPSGQYHGGRGYEGGRGGPSTRGHRLPWTPPPPLPPRPPAAPLHGSTDITSPPLPCESRASGGNGNGGTKGRGSEDKQGGNKRHRS